MPNIDIPISPDLQQAFQLPPCSQLSAKVVKPISITLPTGGTLSGLSDLSRGIPTDCSVTFSLMLQLAPFLASTECLFKVLALIGPLMDVIQALVPPNPPKALLALPKLLQAVENLAPCIAVVTGLGIIPFLKDLICFILKALNCFLSQLQSLMAILGGLTLRLNAATAAGNTELAGTLQCAHDDALAQAGQLTNAIEPIGLVLQMAGTLAGFAGQQINVQMPTLGPEVSLDSLKAIVLAVQDVVAILTGLSEVLGGCDG